MLQLNQRKSVEVGTSPNPPPFVDKLAAVFDNFSKARHTRGRYPEFRIRDKGEVLIISKKLKMASRYFGEIFLNN